MKIKTKKQLNLPQLIEWGFNNPELVKGKLYLTKEHDEYSPYVQFSVDGYGVRTSQSINNKDTFTVEVEEEITEDTELDLIERFIFNNKIYYMNPQAMSINTCLGAALDDVIITHFYIENDERELVLIWRNGRLIE